MRFVVHQNMPHCNLWVHPSDITLLCITNSPCTIHDDPASTLMTPHTQRDNDMHFTS